MGLRCYRQHDWLLTSSVRVRISLVPLRDLLDLKSSLTTRQQIRSTCGVTGSLPACQVGGVGSSPARCSQDHRSTCSVTGSLPAWYAGGVGSSPAGCSGNRAQHWELTHGIASVFATEVCWFDSNLARSSFIGRVAKRKRLSLLRLAWLPDSASGPVGSGRDTRNVENAGSNPASLTSHCGLGISDFGLRI